MSYTESPSGTSLLIKKEREPQILFVVNKDKEVIWFHLILIQAYLIQGKIDRALIIF